VTKVDHAIYAIAASLFHSVGCDFRAAREGLISGFDEHYSGIEIEPTAMQLTYVKFFHPQR
jgi:hypothetical protein